MPFAWADGAPTDVIATVEGQAPVDRALYDHWATIATRRGTEPIKAQELREQVLGFLLASRWVAGEAAERGIAVTPQEIDEAFAEQKEQAFPKEADFKKFLKESGSTEADIRFQLEIEQLQSRLVRQLMAGVPALTPGEIERFYRANRGLFFTPESRDIRMVRTKRRATAALARRELEAGASWRSVARRHSIDRATRKRGGLQEGITEDEGEAAIFRARRSVLTGPAKIRGGYLVFEVRRIVPARQESLKEATPTIKSLLTSRKEQQALETFVTAYRAKWKARTSCMATHTIKDCGATLPPPAPPA
ncbi:MAG: peptidyl-prolyl cis-trans isomerase [Solirubrobacteraceae bacterium]|nr:peptidyl-prolyl cis-trans isomerase [Solirubrobacteraceae bacterium]